MSPPTGGRVVDGVLGNGYTCSLVAESVWPPRALKPYLRFYECTNRPPGPVIRSRNQATIRIGGSKAARQSQAAFKRVAGPGAFSWSIP